MIRENKKGKKLKLIEGQIEVEGQKKVIWSTDPITFEIIILTFISSFFLKKVLS